MIIIVTCGNTMVGLSWTARLKLGRNRQVHLSFHRNKDLKCESENSFDWLSRPGLMAGASLHPSKLGWWWCEVSTLCNALTEWSSFSWIQNPRRIKIHHHFVCSFQPTPGWEWLLENEGSSEEGEGSRKRKRRGNSKPREDMTDTKEEKEEEGWESEGMAMRRRQRIESQLVADLKLVRISCNLTFSAYHTFNYWWKFTLLWFNVHFTVHPGVMIWDFSQNWNLCNVSFCLFPNNRKLFQG